MSKPLGAHVGRAYFLGFFTPLLAVGIAAAGLYLVEMLSYPRQSPIPASTANLTLGAQTYIIDCAFCHGLPGRSKSNAARGVSPAPPQFFQTGDNLPTGLLWYRIHKGLRLTAMPGFGPSLSTTQIWQLALLIENAKNLPADVRTVLEAAPPAAVPGGSSPSASQ